MKLKTLIPWALLCVCVLIGATTTQVIGPNSTTTPNAVVRWKDTSGWKTLNSSVIIDDNGNMQGLIELDAKNLYLTNGFIFTQKSSAPTVSDIGGSVGVSTNYIIINRNGALVKYWSDGTTLYGPQEIGTH